MRTAFVATYPPRRCGIATFTYHLATAFGDREIVALHPPGQTIAYPIEVHHRIRRDEHADYARAARALANCVDLVSIQRGPGIWGGDDGAHVIDFVRALDVPTITTLHSVPPDPTPGRRSVLSELVAHSVATVVMSRSAATLLTTAYGVDARRIEVIPHGVPDIPLVDPETMKPGLGLEGRDVILSFGLLGPGKGIELALDALPKVVAEVPSALYVIVGATRPDMPHDEEEAYRRALLGQVHRLGLVDHVRFVDRFVGRVELTRWLEAADVFVIPSPDLDQVVSGTLSYAMGAGRAIISTPSTVALELLSDGRGVLVSPGSPADLATALNAVLGDRGLREGLGQRAYEHSRGMVWSSVGAAYRRLFDAVTTSPPLPVRSSPLAVATA